jgi:hypothetical protein
MSTTATTATQDNTVDASDGGEGVARDPSPKLNFYMRQLSPSPPGWFSIKAIRHRLIIAIKAAIVDNYLALSPG